MPDPLARRVEALADLPSAGAVRVGVEAWNLTNSNHGSRRVTNEWRATTAHDLDRIVVATVGCWSPETRAGVLRTLLEERLEAARADLSRYNAKLPEWEAAYKAMVFCEGLLSPLPADAREDTHDGE
jgi:hypothetical protein